MDGFSSLLVQFGIITPATMALAEYFPIRAPRWIARGFLAHPRRASAFVWALLLSGVAYAIGAVRLPKLVEPLEGSIAVEFAIVAILALASVAAAHVAHKAKRAVFPEKDSGGGSGAD